MSGNNTTKKRHFDGCDRSNLITIIGWNVLGIGVVCNALLLYFVVKKLAAGKRNDKLFLMNIIVANVLSLFGSLLGEVLNRQKTSSFSLQRYSFYFHTLNFLSLFTNITFMAALCYDRYESVTKFPGQRRLSFGKSLKMVALIWVLPIVLIPIAGSAFIKDELLGTYRCRIQCNETLTTWDITSFSALISFMTLSISVNSGIIIKSLWAIYTKLKKHRQETEKVLGTTRTVKEVNLKKQALAMVVCYSICSIPQGIAAGLMAAKIIHFQSCFYFGCLVATHGSAITTPLIYLTLDKRFRFKLSKSLKRKYGRGTAPISP